MLKNRENLNNPELQQMVCDIVDIQLADCFSSFCSFCAEYEDLDPNFIAGVLMHIRLAYSYGLRDGITTGRSGDNRDAPVLEFLDSVLE